MPPTLSDYEYTLGESGTILNSDFGGVLPFVDISSITGLDSAPIRTTTNEHEGADGSYIDASNMSMRTIVASGTVYDDAFNTEILCDSLRAEYSNSQIVPFYFKQPGRGIRFINVQGGGAQYNIDTNRRLGQTPIQLTMLASDPYIYDYPGNFDSATYAAVSSVGFGFNTGFNLGFGGPIASSSVTVVNSGTHTAYPIFSLYGILTNPEITDSLSNINMRFATTLAASDTIVIDCRYKSVILNSMVSRRNTYAGLAWFAVPPGTSDTFYLSADAGTGAISVTLYNTYY